MELTYEELAPDEERITVKLAQSGNVSAIHRLIASVLPLIKLEAFKASKLCSMSMDELISEGVIGLHRSLKMFDPNAGIRFSTYAVGEQGWVKTYIEHAVHQSHIIYLSKYYRKKGAELNFVGFDSPVSDHGNAMPISEIISADNPTDIQVEVNGEVIDLEDIDVYTLIAKLPDGIEKEIVTKFAAGMSCRELGKEYNMNRMTAIRNRDRAIASIRKIIKCRV
jgi:RNA polymerase sigma factor (sigma-70 family)